MDGRRNVEYAQRIECPLAQEESIKHNHVRHTVAVILANSVPDQLSSCTDQLTNDRILPLTIGVSQALFNDVRRELLFREANVFAVHLLLELNADRLRGNLEQVLQYKPNSNDMMQKKATDMSTHVMDLNQFQKINEKGLLQVLDAGNNIQLTLNIREQPFKRLIHLSNFPLTCTPRHHSKLA